MDIADAIKVNAERLVAMKSMDNEKLIRETSTLDVLLVVDRFRYFAKVIRSKEDSTSVLDGDILSIVLREPIGVVGMIVP